MGARKKTKRKRKKKGQQAPRPTDVVASAEPQLAEGTRSDITAQPTKGMCFATRCETVDEFVATFHRYCEDSSIFIPDARRDVGTSLAFSFELADKQSALLGAGTVVEELATADNRFGRVGIVVSVKKLKPESIEVFKRMLAARTEARAEPRPEVAHARGRAMTGPILIDDVRAVLRPTRPLEVHIPNPGERASTKPRATPVPGVPILGVPVIAKAPAKQPVVQIPQILPRRDAKGSRPIPISDATPRPIFDTPDTVVEGDAIPDVEEDTFHDDVPFALRNELRVHEERAPAPVVDVDSGWELDDPAPPAASLVAAREPAATALEPDRERSAAHEPIALPPPPIDAVPVPTAWVYSGAATTPDAAAMREHVEHHDQPRTSSSWWQRRLAWAAVLAVAAMLVVGVMAIVAFVERSTSTSAGEQRASDPPAAAPTADRESSPTGDEQPATDGVPPATGGDEVPSAREPSPATGEQHPFLPQDRRIAPEPAPSGGEQRGPEAPAPQPNGAAQSTAPSKRRSLPERRSATPDRPRPINAPPPGATPTRPRAAPSKKPCAGLDCL